MGSKTKAQWTEKEEVAFAEGVRHHDREFELIQRDYLPHKTMGQVWECVGVCGLDMWERYEVVLHTLASVGGCLPFKGQYDRNAGSKVGWVWTDSDVLRQAKP